MDPKGKYHRQIILPGFGSDCQQLLRSSKVLVIGAGGLGCPALLYLAAAGIGTLGIADDDIVDLTNLHRQILYNENDVGKSKAITASEKIQASFPECSVFTYNIKIDRSNILSIIGQYDVIVDGTDNLSTRYLINDACSLRSKPWVYGSVYKYQGQVAVFNHSSTSYRDVFPEASSSHIPNCSETGVLGVLAGIIGNLQANEVIKLITNTGIPAINKLLTFDALSASFYEVAITPNPDTVQRTPKTDTEFLSGRSKASQGKCNILCNTIDGAEAQRLLTGSLAVFVDVRDSYEEPEIENHHFLKIPLDELADQHTLLSRFEHMIIVCSAGQRSKAAAMYLKKIYPQNHIVSLEGGLNNWSDFTKTLQHEHT